MICWSAECISVLLQMGIMAVSNSAFQWNCFTKPLFHRPFFGRTICGKERTRPRSFVARFRRAAVLQSDTPNGTCAGDQFAFPVLVRRAAGAQLPVPTGMKQAGGKVHSSTLTCLDSVSDGKRVSEAFQRAIKKEA